MNTFNSKNSKAQEAEQFTAETRLFSFHRFGEVSAVDLCGTCLKKTAAILITGHPAERIRRNGSCRSCDRQGNQRRASPAFESQRCDLAAAKRWASCYLCRILSPAVGSLQKNQILLISHRATVKPEAAKKKTNKCPKITFIMIYAQ